MKCNKCLLKNDIILEAKSVKLNFTFGSDMIYISFSLKPIYIDKLKSEVIASSFDINNYGKATLISLSALKEKMFPNYIIQQFEKILLNS